MADELRLNIVLEDDGEAPGPPPDPSRVATFPPAAPSPEPGREERPVPAPAAPPDPTRASPPAPVPVAPPPPPGREEAYPKTYPPDAVPAFAFLREGDPQPPAPPPPPLPPGEAPAFAYSPPAMPNPSGGGTSPDAATPGWASAENDNLGRLLAEVTDIRAAVGSAAKANPTLAPPALVPASITPAAPPQPPRVAPAIPDPTRPEPVRRRRLEPDDMAGFLDGMLKANGGGEGHEALPPVPGSPALGEGEVDRLARTLGAAVASQGKGGAATPPKLEDSSKPDAADAALMAAGPEGMAVEAAKKAAEAEWMAFKEAVHNVTEATKDLAGNDNLGALSKAANSSAFALGLVSPALGAAVKGTVAVVGTFADVVQSFINRGKELAQYSPALAASGARAEVTNLLSDLREAEELGPDLARLQDAQTELIAFLREVLLPVKKWILEVLANIMEKLVEWAKSLYEVGLNGVEIMKELPGLIALALTGDTDEIKRSMRLIRDTVQRQLKMMEENRDGKPEGVFESLLNDAVRFPFMPPRAFDPVLGV